MSPFFMRRGTLWIERISPSEVSRLKSLQALWMRSPDCAAAMNLSSYRQIYYAFTNEAKKNNIYNISLKVSWKIYQQSKTKNKKNKKKQQQINKVCKYMQLIFSNILC